MTPSPARPHGPRSTVDRRRWRAVAAGTAAWALLGAAAAGSEAASGEVPEATAQAAVGATVEATVDGSDDRWRLPSSGPVGALFVAPDSPWGAGHRGVDLVAGVGALVTAPRAGVVTFAGTVVDRGVVTLLHPDGRRSSLEPVAPTVSVGETVESGAVLGTLRTAAAHCAGCLHWGVRAGERYLDPLSLLGSSPVVLLPSVTPVPPPGGRCAAGASPPCASGRSATR